MDKFLLVLFCIIKILVIVVAPIVLYRFRKLNINKLFYGLEIGALCIIAALYIIGFSYVVDSNISSILNMKLLSPTIEDNSTEFMISLESSKRIGEIEADTDYKTHRNEDVYYYNGYEFPLAGRKIECNGGNDYYKYHSDIMTSTAMLLSTYFGRQIDPIEVYNKASDNDIIDCKEPINSDDFFYMISNEYKVNFKVLDSSELKNYILNGKPVLMETEGNGNLSCYQTYFLIYDVNNAGEYLLLDPNDKSYRYICPEGTEGFGNVLKANYNKLSFDYYDLLSDSNRFIVIGGTR